jgi:diguanylate cyclase (GGDEF)-like protein
MAGLCGIRSLPSGSGSRQTARKPLVYCPFSLSREISHLLDFKKPTDVTAVTPPSPPLIDLRDLRLEDARALLEQAEGVCLPSPEESPTAHVQGVIDGLSQLSLKDPLTGLANRRLFHSVLERELDAVAKSGKCALLLLLDIDLFKQINHTYGHLAGDQVLQAVAHGIAACVRSQDTVARYGGEEFAIVLPDCQPPEGEALAEKIRRTVAGLTFPVSPALQLQVSIGGAYAPVWIRSSAELWTERADTQLYLAKAGGRNQVCIDEQQAVSVSAEEKSLLFGQLPASEPGWIENISGDASGNAMQGVRR